MKACPDKECDLGVGDGAMVVVDLGAYGVGAAIGTPYDGDANGDGAVDVNDISYVLFRFGDPR